MRAALVAAIAGGLAVALAAVILLWPEAANPDHVDVGLSRDVLARLDESGAPIEYGDPVRFYLARYPASSVADGLSEYPEELRPAMRTGLLALVARSPHDGVRLYWCGTSRWFEDPVFGDKFNAVGEQVSGAAPRGLDHFPVRLDNHNHVIVDTTRVIPGVAVGTDTAHQAAEGPPCVS